MIFDQNKYKKEGTGGEEQRRRRRRRVGVVGQRLNGSPFLLQPTEGEERALVSRGRWEAHQIHHHPWLWLLERSPWESWYSPPPPSSSLFLSRSFYFDNLGLINLELLLQFISGLQRCGKSCRLRWINYLRPDIRRGRFTPEEEKLIISLHGVVGNRLIYMLNICIIF